MELLTQLFGEWLTFVYHCFDRIVIYGYLSGLSRPEQVVHFFRNVVCVPAVSKEVLSQRTDYQACVEAFARNQRLPIEWAKKGVRKEDHVPPGNTAWREPMVTVSILCSRACSREPPSASPCRSTRPRCKLPHPRTPAQPLHALLLLRPR
jgi:hypothetical protein